MFDSSFIGMFAVLIVLSLACLPCYCQMGDRSAKLRKLNDFRRRLPHCTASALSAILADVRETGIPDGDRNAMRHARDLQNSEPTPFGPVLQTLTVFDNDDEEQKLTIAHPFALLWKASSDCDSFMTFFRAKLADHPPSLENPWHLLLYTDEVTPGNPLATLNKRKFHALYWSFLEFGVTALSREECWFCVATEYSIYVTPLSAGLSQVVAAVLQCFFSGGVNLAVTGVLLPFGVRLWAKLGGFIQDGGAHKFVWHSRGDGASKFCLLCKNLFDQESEIVDEDGSNLLSCDVLTWDELVQASSNDLRKTARYLERKVNLPPAAFLLLQQSLGMTYHKHALLLNRYLDDYVSPVDVYLHDWMHAIFVDGVFNLILYLLLEAVIQIGFTDVYEVFSKYIANWKWPHRVQGANLHGIFAGDREKKHRTAKHIKCQASDGLSLIGVASLFVRKVLLNLQRRGLTEGDCSAECYAFLALADVVELIVASSRTPLQPKTLLTAVEKFLQLFKTAWGCCWMTPKFHWLLHLHDQLGKLGNLLNCFCLERKHRVPKRYATDIANVSQKNSKSLLMEVTSHHLGQLSQHDAFAFEVGLVKGSKASKRTQQVLTAELELGPEAAASIKYSIESRFSPLATCHKGDVILYKDDGGFRAGKVLIHCEVHGLPISMISNFNVHKFDAHCGHSIWTPAQDQNIFIETDQILDTVVYSELPDGKVSVLIPSEFR